MDQNVLIKTNLDLAQTICQKEAEISFLTELLTEDQMGKYIQYLEQNDN